MVDRRSECFRQQRAQGSVERVQLEEADLALVEHPGEAHPAPARRPNCPRRARARHGQPAERLLVEPCLRRPGRLALADPGADVDLRAGAGHRAEASSTLPGKISALSRPSMVRPSSPSGGARRRRSADSVSISRRNCRMTGHGPSDHSSASSTVPGTIRLARQELSTHPRHRPRVARAHGAEELDPVAERKGCEGAGRAMQPLHALVQSPPRGRRKRRRRLAGADPLKRGMSGPDLARGPGPGCERDSTSIIERPFSPRQGGAPMRARAPDPVSVRPAAGRRILTGRRRRRISGVAVSSSSCPDKEVVHGRASADSRGADPAGHPGPAPARAMPSSCSARWAASPTSPSPSPSSRS